MNNVLSIVGLITILLYIWHLSCLYTTSSNVIPLTQRIGCTQSRRLSRPICLTRNNNEARFMLRWIMIWFQQKWPLMIWAKPLQNPLLGSAVIAIVNRAKTGGPIATEFTLFALLTSKEFPISPSELAINNVSSYHVTELFDNRYLGRFKPLAKMRVDINPSGVYLIRLVPATGDDKLPAGCLQADSASDAAWNATWSLHSVFSSVAQRADRCTLIGQTQAVSWSFSHTFRFHFGNKFCTVFSNSSDFGVYDRPTQWARYDIHKHLYESGLMMFGCPCIRPTWN